MSLYILCLHRGIIYKNTRWQTTIPRHLPYLNFLILHPTILRHYDDIMLQSYVARRCRVSPRATFVALSDMQTAVLGRTTFSATLHTIRDKAARQATSQRDNRYLPRHFVSYSTHIGATTRHFCVQLSCVKSH